MQILRINCIPQIPTATPTAANRGYTYTVPHPAPFILIFLIINSSDLPIYYDLSRLSNKKFNKINAVDLSLPQASTIGLPLSALHGHDRSDI